jgi:ATP/maltotriose-dependent transcriptional regulator MalT
LAGTPAGANRLRSRRNSRIPLIRSKFLPPAPPPGAVPRPRLLEELASGRGRALTLVCASADYDKTTLLSSQWIAGAVTADSADVLPMLIEELDQAARDLVLVVADYHLAECTPVAESVTFFVL